MSSVDGINFTTWNCRALLQYEGNHASEKLGYMYRLRLGSSVTAFQEIHQHEAQLRTFLQRVLPGA
eukprot:1810081-Pyramimonas_sp.AAC.1